jgi:hypothetical protein
MANYKYSQYLNTNQHKDFDTLHSPGEKPVNSGIYRCMGCGKEISHNANVSLPPQNHHQHSNGTAIQWKMVVCAQTNG